MPAPNHSPFNRPRWTEHDARTALAALERSVKAVRAFAEEHGLDPQRLYAWRRRVAGGDRTTFRELVVRPSSSLAVTEGTGAPFEIVLASGVVVRVPSSFDGAALARLLEVMARTAAC
jgi:transposase-like protein